MPNKAVLAGRLSFIGLSDLFQILGGNNSTGVLRMNSQHIPNPGIIYFENGNPVNASSGSSQGIEAIYSLFGWTEGSFEFEDQPVNVGRTIKQSRMEIVLNALRMLDDGVIKKVGPPSFNDATVLKADRGKEGESLKVIKGPFVNYSYILEEEDYRDGESIVKEGGHGRWIWVVLEGSVSITRETPSGPLTVARIGEGCFVGTLSALAFRQYARSATATTAKGNVRLGLLDTERLINEYSILSPDFKLLLRSLDGRLKQVTDRVVELHTGNNRNEELTKGKKVILKGGSSRNEAFTIRDGETCVVGKSKKGPLALVTLKKEDVFGNLPFLDIGHEPRSASVMASKDIKVDKLDAESMQKEYNCLSEILRNLIFNVSTYLFMTTRMAYRLHEQQ